MTTEQEAVKERATPFLRLFGSYYVRLCVTSGPPIIWRPRAALTSAVADNGNTASVLSIGVGWWIFSVGVVRESTNA